VIVRTLENVEDMDAASLTVGIVWDFRTYPEYLELVRSRGTEINFTAYVGHSSVRLYVMGDAAYERAATPAEIEEMCRLVTEAIEAGAAGFSTSFAYTHRGVDGKPVPSRFADRDEVGALFMAAGRTGRASCSPPPVNSAPTPTCTSGRRASGGRSPTRCLRSPTGDIIRSSS